ncbi:SCO family protein [Ramlibacter monticola]|uniref:SCO family protein n=1 Tax=Ramlibacter monticola TaxID=1926872 RepID=A0A936Z176_9BURK|nr:SCO family protein [Ramlibacter monticola]MBL0393009.1 SCO family protein [Ramlibacter monticola]
MKHTFLRGALAMVAALALTTVATGVCAHDGAHHGAQEARAPSTVRIKLPDSLVVDQHGKAARFKSDIVGDRLVLVTFVYTTCTTVCPPLSALFADLQQRLGDKVGREVALVTITVDPVRDTPLRLKAYAAQYNAGPGWSFLTGRKQAIDEVLTALGVYTPNFADHPSVVLVGDPRSGEWTRFFGFPSSDQLLARVGQLQAAREGAPLAKNN